MKLTAEEQRKVARVILRLAGTHDRCTIGRLYPISAYKDGTDACRQVNAEFICTRPPGHDEPHVAHGGADYACHAWFDDGTIIHLTDRT